MAHISPADWQLPSGVSRATWDYAHSQQIAESYDDHLAGSSLFAADLELASRHFTTPGRLIDLGCGTGRLLINFATHGFSVLGVDLSEAMLRVAGTKAAQIGARVQLLKANIVELDALADASFDYAACLFSTLGMVAGAEERRRAVLHAHRLLRPGGKFLLHVHNRWFHFWNKEGRRWLLRDTLRTVLASEAAGDRPMPVHQGIAGLKLHHFTRREAVRLLQGVGFRVETVQALSLSRDGRLPVPIWFGWLRAYGYLLVATK
jgi:SAM-dependent methyltransferase